MALSFGRTISFPLILARSFSKPCHVHFVSLPGATSSDPHLANLHAHITAIRTWIQQDTTTSLPAILDTIHAALADLLLLLPDEMPATASLTPSSSSRMHTRASKIASCRSDTRPSSPACATVKRLYELERCFDECDGTCNMVLRSVV